MCKCLSDTYTIQLNTGSNLRSLYQRGKKRERGRILWLTVSRFSPEGKEGRHPLCYLPFGWGQRSCIGMRFAMMEIKMALVNVLREYNFERSAETQVTISH